MRAYNIKRASIFGSYARGDATQESDIDLLIAPRKEFSLFDRVLLRDKLSQLLSRNVDIVSEQSVLPRIRPFIDKDKIVIYER